MPEVKDADQAQNIAVSDLEEWFRIPRGPESWRGPHVSLDFEWLNVHLEGEEWVVSGYARKFAMMGGGSRRTWWGAKRFVDPWLKLLQEEPFQYRINRVDGRIVAKDHNLSPARRDH